MLKSAEKTGTNEYTIELAIGAEAFEAAVNKAYNKNKGRITVPGFRKGKAPRALIEKVYGANVFYDDALELAFPDEYEAALTEAKIDAVDNPRDFDIRSIGKEGVELVCKVTVKPVITIDGYKGLSAVREAVEVSDADVDADLKKKQEDNAREITVEDRKSKKGDIAVIDFEGFTDGVAFDGGKGEDYELELGSGSFIPGFEEQVEDHGVGDSFDVNVTFPEEYAEELAGKAAVFKVTLKGLKEKQLPALDDEFAKDVSEFDTLDELKADIKKTLTDSKEASAKSAFENEIYNKLSALVTEEIPACMIDKAVNSMVTEFRYNIEAQGIPYETYLSYFGMNEDGLKESYKERAEKDVKIELALEKIAELENIEIGEADLEAEYAAMAERYKMDVADVKKAIAEDHLTKELKNRKASSLVLDAAVAEQAEKPKKKAAAKKPAAKKAEDAPAAEEKPAAKKAPAKKAAAKKAPAKKAAAEEPAE